MSKNKVGRTEIVIIIILGSLAWVAVHVPGNAFAGDIANEKSWGDTCDFPKEGWEEPFNVVGSNWIRGEFRFSGMLDARRIGNQIQYQVSDWYKGPGNLYTEVFSRGYWKFTMTEDDISVYEYYDPTKCGDRLFVSGAGLSWPSFFGIRLR